MDLNKLRFIGRHIKNEGREYFSFSGTGFEFNLIPTAKNCSITLFMTSVLHNYDEHYIAIYINDVFHSKEKLTSGLNIIKIKPEKLNKENIIRIIKQNEGYLSAIYLENIELENAEFGEILPSNKEIIGFFGDSLTCGFGLLDLNGQEFKTETEEFTKTYAYLSCFALNMDYTVVARSGISIGIPIYVEKLFGEIYDTVDMSIKCKEDRILDYAVINLGTNDNSGYFQKVNDEDKTEALVEFKRKYLDLIQRIITDNPKVKIVIAYNMLSLEEIIENAIKDVYSFAIACFSNKMCLLKLIPNGEGACFHPYWTYHEKNAKLLANAIKELDKRR